MFLGGYWGEWIDCVVLVWVMVVDLCVFLMVWWGDGVGGGLVNVLVVCELLVVCGFLVWVNSDVEVVWMCGFWVKVGVLCLILFVEVVVLVEEVVDDVVELWIGVCDWVVLLLFYGVGLWIGEVMVLIGVILLLGEMIWVIGKCVKMWIVLLLL